MIGTSNNTIYAIRTNYVYSRSPTLGGLNYLAGDDFWKNLYIAIYRLGGRRQEEDTRRMGRSAISEETCQVTTLSSPLDIRIQDIKTWNQEYTQWPLESGFSIDITER